jgi:hypothetical protein
MEDPVKTSNLPNLYAIRFHFAADDYVELVVISDTPTGALLMGENELNCESKVIRDNLTGNLAYLRVGTIRYFSVTPVPSSMRPGWRMIGPSTFMT